MLQSSIISSRSRSSLARISSSEVFGTHIHLPSRDYTTTTSSNTTTTSSNYSTESTFAVPRQARKAVYYIIRGSTFGTSNSSSTSRLASNLCQNSNRQLLQVGLTIRNQANRNQAIRNQAIIRSQAIRGFLTSKVIKKGEGLSALQLKILRKSLLRHESTTYVVSFWFIVFSFCWATVPLYRMYCQATGQGIATEVGHKDYSFLQYDKNKEACANRIIRMDFQATVHEAMNWEFQPEQSILYIAPGETALAFYRAKNNNDYPVIGASVYSIMPPDAGIYFNKIQCFCFDEQLINPNEEVDLPILFFVDPEFATDSRVNHIENITLSYVFFESDSPIPEAYEEILELREIQKEKHRLRTEIEVSKNVEERTKAVVTKAEKEKENIMLKAGDPKGMLKAGDPKGMLTDSKPPLQISKMEQAKILDVNKDINLSLAEKAERAAKAIGARNLGHLEGESTIAVSTV